MTMRSFALILLFALSVYSAPVPKEVKRQTDAELFVGTWETVVSESNAQPFSKAFWTFDAALTMTSRAALGQGEGGSKWVIKIDPKGSPKTIDIGAYTGIYEFDGPDIKVVYTTGGVRPTEAKSAAGVYYNLLRRVPEKKK